MRTFFEQFSAMEISRIMDIASTIFSVIVLVGLWLITFKSEGKVTVAIATAISIFSIFFIATEPIVKDVFYSKIDNVAQTYTVYINGTEVNYDNIDIHKYSMLAISIDDDNHKIMIAK